MDISKIDQNWVVNYAEPMALLSLYGVTNEGRRSIPFSEIIIDSYDNDAKKNGVDSAKVNEMVEWFSRVVDFSQPIPIVEPITSELDSSGVLKKYRLIDGYNRLEAFRILGLTQYFFDVVNFKKAIPSSYKARISLKLKLNERPPTYKTTIADYSKAVSNLVVSGDLEKNEEAIYDYLSSITCLDNQQIQNVMNNVCLDNDVSRSFKNWTLPYIKSDAPKLGIEISGKFDAHRRANGYTTKKDSGYKTMFQILKALYGGKESYVVAHVPNPGTTQNLKLLRQQTQKEWEDIGNYLHNFGKYYAKTSGKLPYKFEGFLPQNNDVEKNIVKLKHKVA